MHYLFVNSCGLSCHTLLKHFVLNLIKAYIYKATFLYFSNPKSLRSHEVTKKFQYSLYALITLMLTIFTEEVEWDVFIYSSIYPSFFVTSTNKYLNNTYTYIHTYKHTCIHTYIHIHTYKMADDVQQGIENALNKIVHTTDQSGNMKKELNKNIYETVSTLRNLVNRMKVMLEEEVRQKNPN